MSDGRDYGDETTEGRNPPTGGSHVQPAQPLVAALVEALQWYGDDMEIVARLGRRTKVSGRGMRWRKQGCRNENPTEGPQTGSAGRASIGARSVSARYPQRRHSLCCDRIGKEAVMNLVSAGTSANGPALHPVKLDQELEELQAQHEMPMNRHERRSLDVRLRKLRKSGSRSESHA